MPAIVGPILLKQGCYVFDLWTAEEGLSRGYGYRRIEDAHYARNAEIKSRRRQPDAMVVCATLEEFTTAVAERESTYRSLISRLKRQSAGSVRAPERTVRALIEPEVAAVATQ
jgi:hypothetical protein